MSIARNSPDPQPRPLDHLALCGDDDAPALLLKSAHLSYKQLNARIGLLSGWLTSLLAAEEKGARIASWLAKGEMACLLPLAAARAGLVHVPINPVLKRAQAAHILADSGAAMLIAGKARLASLEAGDVPDHCACVEEASAMDAALALGSSMPPSSASPDDLAAILYTSGSTGRPKGVMLSHANLWLGAASVAHYLGLTPDDRVLAVLPFAFDYGQNQLLSCWYAGASVAPLDYLLPRDVARAVAAQRITTLAAVPPLWVQLTELDWPVGASASLTRLTNSGGALTPELIADLRLMAPNARIFAMYGLTEAFRSSYLDPDLLASHPRSIGKAIPFAELMLVTDDGREADPGEEGELVHAGPLVAQGYWRDEARTAERFKPAPAWSEYGGMAVWSGDRMRRDEAGLLYFVGRRDAMIKSAGNRISPQEIEEAAIATGLVAEAVALGIADERLGQAVHLVVRAAADAVDAEMALAKALARELPNYMAPKVIHWRAAMPLGATGKIDRVALAAEIALEGQS